MSSEDSGGDSALKLSPADGLIAFVTEASVHKSPEHGIRFT
jgi:hypothetical protein